MNSEFEKRLGEFSVRPIPAEWRAEIVRAANEASPAQPVSGFLGGLREWLWPHPKAWAGIAAAWCVIFALRLTTPDTEVATGSSAITWQTMAKLQRQTDEFMRSFDSLSAVPPPTPDPVLRPRTNRQSSVAIG
jgi:hypothetical protein